MYINVSLFLISGLVIRWLFERFGSRRRLRRDATRFALADRRLHPGDIVGFKRKSHCVFDELG
jgi:hypothetical protein